MNITSKLATCVALGLLAGSMAANAVPLEPLKMDIVLHEDGFGGSGASWSGSFETGDFNPDGSFWVVTRFSVLVNGVAYDQIYDLLGLFLFLDADPNGPLQLLGVVTPGALTETPVQAIQFDARFINGVADPVWDFTPCSTVSCGGVVARSHYSLSSVETSVPEPGTLALFAFGLAGITLIRRRRPH
jgi:PEP-CTERM motif-containing protein